VLASHSLTDKELDAQLTDEANLRGLLLEELRMHGIKTERDISFIARLLRGLILSIDRKHGKEGNEDLMRWLFNGINSSPLTLLSSYNITEAEYIEVIFNFARFVFSLLIFNQLDETEGWFRSFALTHNSKSGWLSQVFSLFFLS
jgi:hypothetical protein